jgi:hypothetical protein
VIADRLGGRVSRLIWAEASLAPSAGAAELVGEDGVLPPWSAWWGPDAMATLVPDADRRQVIDEEAPPADLLHAGGAQVEVTQ